MKNIFKTLSVITFAMLLCALPVSITFAQTQHSPRFVDDAGLTDESENKQITASLDEISEKYKLDVVIVTTDSIDNKTISDYADDYFDYNNYGYGDGDDGVILVVSMGDRDWGISTKGYGITAFTDAGIEYIGENVASYLSDEEYAQAFNEYAQLCDKFIKQAKSGSPYDTNSMPKEPYNFVMWIFIAAAVGFAVGGIVIFILRSQLKSVAPQASAANYVKPGSLSIKDSRDIYLYSNITKTPRPKETSGGSSTHTSSSGSTHGGGSGKF